MPGHYQANSVKEFFYLFVVFGADILSHVQPNNNRQ